MHQSLFPILAAAVALQSTAMAAFNKGDAVSTASLTKAELIQGQVPQTWEPGKLYILECWATWCGPCIAAIPHVDALYDKYKDQGLRVIGVNVMEADKGKVGEFVKGKGDGMSYPVIFTGKGPEVPFAVDYLTPGEVKGIPHAFVIKDGKFILSTHPAGLTEALIEGLLAGGDKQEAVIKKFENQATINAKMEPLFSEFSAAQRKGDAAAMEAKLAEIEQLDPTADFLPGMRISIQVAKKDWPALEKSLTGLPAEEDSIGTVFKVARTLDVATGVPDSTRKALTAKFKALESFGQKASDPTYHVMMSRCQWLSGDKDSAKASAQKAVDTPSKFPAEVLKSYAESLTADAPQSFADVIMNARKAVK